MSVIESVHLNDIGSTRSDSEILRSSTFTNTFIHSTFYIFIAYINNKPLVYNCVSYYLIFLGCTLTNTTCNEIIPELTLVLIPIAVNHNVLQNYLTNLTC